MAQNQRCCFLQLFRFSVVFGVLDACQILVDAVQKPFRLRNLTFKTPLCITIEVFGIGKFTIRS